LLAGQQRLLRQRKLVCWFWLAQHCGRERKDERGANVAAKSAQCVGRGAEPQCATLERRVSLVSGAASRW
jgi:hypothetical protein